MLGILWMILKVLLILLGVLLALLLIALVLPVTAELAYEQGQFRARVGTLGLFFQVFPGREKPEGKQKPKKAAKPKKPKKKKGAEASGAAGKEKPKSKKKRLKLSVDTICEMVSTAGTLLRRVLAGLKIHAVRIRMPIQGSDAADTAVRYGQMNAYIHSALAVLHNGLDIRVQELALVPDFNGEKQGTELFSCKITSRLIIMVIAGVRALIQLIKAGVI